MIRKSGQNRRLIAGRTHRGEHRDQYKMEFGKLEAAHIWET